MSDLHETELWYSIESPSEMDDLLLEDVETARRQATLVGAAWKDVYRVVDLDYENLVVITWYADV